MLSAVCRPALYGILLWIQCWPYISGVIPHALRRYLAERLPHSGFQRLRALVQVMHEHSVTIYQEKKAALAKGDEGAKQLFREGKDLMSIMCKRSLLYVS